jgi:V8-like Glu-specific endopeptidase
MDMGMRRFVLSVPLIAGFLLLLGTQLSAQQGIDFSTQWTRLQQAFAQGELKGRFIERTPGNYVFVPESRDLPAVRVLNPQKIASASTGVQLVIKASYDNGKKGIEVEDYHLPEVVVSSARIMATPRISVEAARRPPVIRENLSTRTPGVSPQPIEKTLSTFRNTLTEALKPGMVRADSISLRNNLTINQAARLAEKDLTRVYRDAVKRGDAGMDERREAVRGLADVRQEIKAIYGTYDNYPPWSYNRIFSNARSVVAIAEPGQTRMALCSGVLVAQDLVLTAGHCFKMHYPKDLEVWFGFAETTEQQVPSPIVRKITELVAPPADQHEEFLTRASEERFDAEMPDYAIVRIETNDAESPAQEIEPQCLREHHVFRDRSLYVIGYPKGTPEMVHDNGRVYLPFRLRAREFEDLKRDIEVDFAMLEDEERLRLLEEFVASYVQQGEGIDMVFELYDTRWGGQPKIGIVADLFQGNSGSPVFDRDNHCIVGIHTGGAADTGQRLGASWQTHETVLPVPAILSNLEKYSQTSPLVTAGTLTIQ